MVLWRTVSTSDILAALARLGLRRPSQDKGQPTSRTPANSDVPPRR